MEHGGNTGFWLMAFNVISFLVVLGVLAKFGWPAILKALAERENSIRKDIEVARESRETAEQMKKDLERQIAGIEARAQELIAQAQKKGDEIQAAAQKTAEHEAKNILERAGRQMDEERGLLMRELRSHLGSMAAQAAEKMLRRSVDKSVQDTVLGEFLKELETAQS